MTDPIDKTWLFLDKQPKDIWIDLSNFKLKDEERFIQLVKSCIDFNYNCEFNHDYKKIKIISHY